MALQSENSTICYEKEDVNYIMLTDRESSLNNFNPVDIDFDQETTTDTNQVEGSSIHQDHPFVIHNSSVLHNQTDIDHDVSSSSDDSFINIAVDNSRISFTASLNESILSDQRSISQNTNAEDIPRNKYHRKASIAVTKSQVLCCKLSIVFAICCTTICTLMPIYLYYVSQIGNNVPTAPEYSHERNTTTAKINLMRNCNFIDSDCVDQILYTYEALRTINLPSSQQYCSERVETLFCDALMECSNEFYVKDIVCQQVRQEYCTAEWRMLEVHNQTDGLIDCEKYEETAPLNCSNQFDLANDESVCLPLCEEFSQFSEAYTTPRTILFSIFLFIGVVGGIIVVAISYRKRKKMFHFPQVLVAINAGLLSIIHIMIIISIITSVAGRRNILCSTRFLFDALDNSTPFCTVEGCLVTSGFVVYAYFWLWYICHLALNIVFPLKAAKLHNSGYRRIIIIVELSFILVIGTTPSIVSAGLSYYEILSFPPTQCGSNGAIRFYEVILPIMICITICGLLMLLTLYKLHVSHGIFKTKHRDSIGKQICACQFTVPEIKITFVLFYWVVHSVLLWTSLSVRSGRNDIFDYHLRSYTDCMAGGNRRDHDCNSLRMDLEAESNPVLEVITFLSAGFLNFASLPFVIQYQTVKNSVKATRHH